MPGQKLPCLLQLLQLVVVVVATAELVLELELALVLLVPLGRAQLILVAMLLDQ
jgi:hypothetical protein